MKKILLLLIIACSLCITGCDKKAPQFVAKDEAIRDTTRHFDEEVPTHREAKRRERLKRRSSKKSRVITLTSKKQRDRMRHSY